MQLELELEVGLTPIEADYESGFYTPYDNTKHRLLTSPPEWLHSLRHAAARRNINSDLFLYYHEETQKFVLSSWIRRPGEGGMQGLFLELETYDDQYSPHPLSYFLGFRLLPHSELMSQSMKRLKDRRKKERDMRIASRGEAKEAAKFHRGKGEYEMAQALDEGAVPFVGVEEQKFLGIGEK